MPSVLVTGAAGMVGSTMIDYILAEKPDYDVVAMQRRESNLNNIAHVLDHPRVHPEIGDLLDIKSLERILAAYRPERCFHTAGMSHVPTAWKHPQACMEVNVIGQINLFEAIRSICPDCRIQICGSSEEYGLVHKDEVPIKETNPLRPLSPYGCSKISQDMLGYQYAQGYGLKVIRTRAFNHSGARRHKDFAEASFSIQIARIEQGLCAPVIEHGNLEAIRDMTNVKDVVRAYWMSLDGDCAWGEVYNICSGKGPRINEMLAYLISLTDTDITLKPNPDLMRPSDIPVLIGDHTRFREATGWQPTRTWQETIAECLDYWREQIKSTG